MLSPVLLGICSLLFSLLLTPLFRDLALRLGWVDQPDHERKLHKAPIPRIGGVPIVLAYAGAFGVLMLLGLRVGVQMPPLVWKLLPPALIVFSVGLLDDLAGLKPWQKLLGLTAASFLACAGGLRIDNLADYDMGVF